jgi:molecular chaperone DnaK
MARLKIDFGIDLGTTNSAIAVTNNGASKIFKTDVNGDTMPSCVMVTKNGFRVGAKAFALLPKDKKKAFTDTSFKSNIFIEFKRTIGNTTEYVTDKGTVLSSEDLSAEVLKTLKSFVDLPEGVRSAIITIPAAFEMNQINATKKAAELAGLEYVELVQEPYAAAIAYADKAESKNGFWLVFDFGGGTFDSALVKTEAGIIKVIDSEGDNFLGGKNLDEAIVDQIFIPYFKENYSIDSILNDNLKFQAFKEMWKPKAEEVKNQLSFKTEDDILTDLYDEYGADDEGKEFEIELTINRNQLKEIFKPFIQRAIDISNKLLERNNLSGSTLDELIFVGGPTLSPILRDMVETQIRKPNTSVDPMTVVAIGASIYASSINNNIKREVSINKVQLDIGYESMVVGKEVWINLKKLSDNNDKIFVEISRTDKGWKSEKVEINNIGDVIEVLLNEGETNVFDVISYDEKGNKIECEPNTFSIKEGTSLGGAPLPHSVCIEVKDKVSGNKTLKPLIGLEKNKTLPANGIYNGLKTQKQIRPGMDDFIKIPIYQGKPLTKALHNNYVSNIIITGNDLPSLLPENSEANLTINIDTSNQMTGKIDFIDIDFQMDFKVKTEQSEITNIWLTEQINDTKISFNQLDNNIVEQSKIDELENKIETIEKAFSNNKTDAGKLEHRSHLQEVAKEIEELNSTTEWPKLEEKIKEEFYRLEKINKELGNDQTTKVVNQFRNEVEEVIQTKDVKLGTDLFDRIHSFFFEMTRVYQLMGLIKELNRDFDSLKWKDTGRARTLVNDGITIINESPSLEELQPIVNEVLGLLPEGSKPSGDDSVFVG